MQHARCACFASLLAVMTLLPFGATAGPEGDGPPPPLPPHGTLLLDQAVYKIGDCISMTLTVPPAAIGEAPLQPTVELATTNGNVLRGRRAGVRLTEALPYASPLRVFSTRQCVELRPDTYAAQGDLAAAPGDAVIVLARNVANGSPLAIGVGTISGGSGSGRFRAIVDPQVAPPSRQRAVPVGAIVDPQGHRATLVEDHVIFRETKPGGLQAFLTRRGGQVLHTLTVPAHDSQPGPRAEPSIFHVVKVDLSTVDSSNFELLVERFTSLEGTWRYSSENSLRLVAMVAQELAAGNMIFTDDVGSLQARPISNEGLNDAFLQKWFDLTIPSPPAVRLSEAMALAEILLKPTPTTPKIMTAFIDGGFAQDGDFPLAPEPSGMLDYGMKFGVIPGCQIDSIGIDSCGAGMGGGPNAGTCGGMDCPWHGTEVFSAAGAQLNNTYGAAGVGWRAVSPVFMRLADEQTLMAQASAVTKSVDLGAKVINMSLSADCIRYGVNWCDPFIASLFGGFFCALVDFAYPGLRLPCAVIVTLATLLENETALEKAIEDAEKKGAVVVAAAGNADLSSGEVPVDVSDVHRVPCILKYVICVGALNSGSTAPFILRAPFSGFGDFVNVWAPGTFLAISPTPDRPLPTVLNPNLPVTSGTSVATPIVSGSLALARALAPGLMPAQIRKLLADSNCKTGGTGRVAGADCKITGDPEIDTKGYLDALELVRRARTEAGRPSLGLCTGGFGSDERGAANCPPAKGVGVAALPGLAGFDTAYSLLADGDLVVHALRNPIELDDDWYKITMEPRCPATAFVATVTVPVPDPSLGSLIVNVFSSESLVPVPIISVCSPVTSSWCLDRIDTTLILQSDATYFVQVTARNFTQTNCYSRIKVRLHNLVTPNPNAICPAK